MLLRWLYASSGADVVLAMEMCIEIRPLKHLESTLQRTFMFKFFLHTFQASSSLVQYVLQSTVLAEIRWFAVRKPCPLFNLSISHSCVILLLWLQQIIINNYTANIIKLVLWLPNLCILHLVSYHQTSIKLCTYYFQASR